jgi:tRNA A37 threonylcarbamoyladenosine dehydratase
LRVGVIGGGSVGALARTGVQRVRLIDFDAVERHNLDRLVHATRRDFGRPKVAVSA